MKDKDKEQDIVELLDAVIWGHRIIDISIDNDNKVTYIIRPLTLEEKNMGNYIYKRTLINSKLLTREQLRQQAIEQDLWKSTYENDIKSLRQELDIQLKERDEEVRTKMLDGHGRPKRQSATTKLIKLNAKIAQICHTINELESFYTQHIELPCAEYHAECERCYYFLQCATLTFPDMEPVWDSMRKFQEETNTVLVTHLMREYYNDSVVRETLIRRIARSGLWRCKWIASKSNRGVRTLFGREMFDLTLDQFRLVYWSQVYDSAFESINAPSDRVIENDELFDQWLEEQHQKRNQERKKSEFDQKINKFDKKATANEVGFSVIGEYCWECNCGIKEEAKQRGHDKRGHIHAPECSYGVFLYYDQKTKQRKIEEVQSANPESVRKILVNEQKRLAMAGVHGIEEQHLRGDKARAAFGMNTSYYGKGEHLNKGKQGRARPS